MNLSRGWASSEAIWNTTETVGPSQKELRTIPQQGSVCWKGEKATDGLMVTRCVAGTKVMVLFGNHFLKYYSGKSTHSRKHSSSAQTTL